MGLEPVLLLSVKYHLWVINICMGNELEKDDKLICLVLEDKVEGDELSYASTLATYYNGHHTSPRNKHIFCQNPQTY